MQHASPLNTIDAKGTRFSAGWAFLIAMLVVLAAALLPSLWRVWRSDPSLSHGPLVPVAVAAMLWTRRSRFGDWNAAATLGLLFTIFSALGFAASMWADIAFFKPVFLVCIALGTIWFLGGSTALTAAGGPLGFLAFMVPWPTLLIDKLAFPMQLMSTSYAAMTAGLLGVPIVREGVQISVVPDPEKAPVYSILVARECSGLTSMLVLLALGYLISFATPLKFGWKALLMACVIPLAITANVIRLVAILLFGAHSSPEMAQWVHDNEAPVLIFFCSLALLAVRYGMIRWTESRAESNQSPEQSRAPI